MLKIPSKQKGEKRAANFKNVNVMKGKEKLWKCFRSNEGRDVKINATPNPKLGTILGKTPQIIKGISVK
jgi:hypothetical protein